MSRLQSVVKTVPLISEYLLMNIVPFLIHDEASNYFSRNIYYEPEKTGCTCKCFAKEGYNKDAGEIRCQA